MCPVDGYNLITEYFNKTLQDILIQELVGNYFFKEPDLWKFVWSLNKILQFNNVRNIKR